jgi:predicted nucleic acid-binding protein
VIFVDTSFFYALFTEEDDNHQRAVEAFKELEGRRLPELLLTTNHIVFETITLMSFKRTGHERAVYVGERLYAEKLARIYRATAEDETAAFENLAPFSFNEKFFSIWIFGGSAPPKKFVPTSISVGKSWGLGAGSQACYVEPQ